MSVDLRTRSDAEPGAAVDPAVFFGHDLPAAIEAHPTEVLPGAAWLRLRPLTVEIDGEAWSLALADQRLAISAGATIDGSHIRLTQEQLTDVVHDQLTFMGLWTSGTLDQPSGRIEHLLDWWLVLRAALDGQPVHVPGAITFRDRDGAPLDLGRHFRLDDDPADLQHFLQEAGFLHLVGVFTEEEMAEISADMDRAAPSYAEGDGRSWWAVDREGEHKLVRMQGFDGHSPATADLIDDTRFRAIGAIPGDGHVHGDRRPDNRIEALFKPLGIVQGISDIPWHKDCSLGRHSYECCSLTTGISVTGADEMSGQLRVRAGSHRALIWPAIGQRDLDLPDLPLPTSTGDVTVHLSCTMHMAQEPVERERRVMYSGFSLPLGDSDAIRAARARMRETRESAPLTASARGIHA